MHDENPYRGISHSSRPFLRRTSGGYQPAQPTIYKPREAMSGIQFCICFAVVMAMVEVAMKLFW